MNLESSLQMGFEWSRNRLFHLLMSKAIKGQKFRLAKFDQKAVIILGLNTENTNQFKARFLISFNFRNAKVNSGFIAVRIFSLWLPGISVCRVTEDSTY